ncbi:hypothetical protein BMH30_14880, partial [Leucobacter sp. OLES1]
ATWIDFIGDSVGRVEVNGDEQPVRYDGARIRIDGLGGTAEAAAAAVVRVEALGVYSRSGEGLHRYVDPADGETYLYTQYEPADARRVMACFEQPDLKAEIAFSVRAPEAWTVLSNTVPTGERVADAPVEFAPTKPISSYITAVAAGPYFGVRDSWTKGDGSLEIPLGVYCRASLAEHLDADEILPWLERVEAASLAVCRPTTGARIEQRPVGGWNDAGLGIGSLAGGPNRLLALGSWSVREGTQSSTLHLRGLDPEVQLLIEAAQEALDYVAFDRVRRAALSDALTWRTSLGIARDTVGLGIERNLVRHWPVATQIRLAEAGELAELIRVLAAALIVRAPITVSTGVVLPAPVVSLLERQGIEVSLERDDDWLERMSVLAAVADASNTADAGSRGSDGGTALIGVDPSA